MPADPPLEQASPTDAAPATRRDRLRHHIRRKAGPGSRFFAVLCRVLTGAWNDGFIHAGNLAYMTLLALFPFFIALAAIFSALGEQARLDASIDALLLAMPPRVAEVIAPVARDVVAARHGWLLWIGGLFGLWTAASLIETIRDILHRAYKARKHRAFWHYRLFSTALIFGSVLLLLISLSAQVLLGAIQEVLVALFPRLDSAVDQIIVSRTISTATLFGSLYALFYLLTPNIYQRRICPKWPGAVLVTLWWLLVAWALPQILRTFFAYDLTYGSLAGVMIALFFFWLVGLGMVMGAELNAALAESLGQAAAPSGPGDNEVRDECE